MWYFISFSFFISGLILLIFNYVYKKESNFKNKEIENVRENLLEIKSDIQNMTYFIEDFKIISGKTESELKNKYNTFRQNYTNEFEKPFDIEIMKIEYLDNKYFLYLKYGKLRLEENVCRNDYNKFKKEFDRLRIKYEKMRTERYIFRNNT